jgi:hypothetical protein
MIAGADKGHASFISVLDQTTGMIPPKQKLRIRCVDDCGEKGVAWSWAGVTGERINVGLPEISNIVQSLY